MLLVRLIEKQTQLGESDGEFAARLDIPRSTWQAYRTGRVPLTPRVARKARTVFPDLAADALSFLLGDASDVATSDMSEAEVA